MNNEELLQKKNRLQSAELVRVFISVCVCVCGGGGGGGGGVELTLNPRCLNVVCMLGYVRSAQRTLFRQWNITVNRVYLVVLSIREK